MLDIQLGRRNLPPQQRIAVVKKFEKKIQKQAKITQGARIDLTSSPNGEKVITSTRTDKELAKLAGVGKETYRMGAKILDSDNKSGITPNLVEVRTKSEKMKLMLNLQILQVLNQLHIKWGQNVF